MVGRIAEQDNLRRMVVLALTVLVASADGAFPRVWMSLSGVHTAAEFEKAVVDCKAHGVDVVKCAGGAEPADQLAICRRHGMKLFLAVEDACRIDWEAKRTGRYELAVMSGGCYRGLAVDRHLFSFSPGRHEIIVEPPVYSKGQAYAATKHHHLLGDGHYFGGYVPTGRAEIVVPEKLFDGRQHLRILPAKVELAPADALPENDSAKALAGTDEIRNRRLVKLSFDLTGLETCRLDKVGIAVYWRFDDSDPKWQADRASYSVASPVTRKRMRERIRARLEAWSRANGGAFPSDVLAGVRLGDEYFNPTSWLDCPAASYPLWDYSESALADFERTTPEGVTYPRTWGANDVYGDEACGQFLYRYHKAVADYLKEAVDEAHAVSPSILAFRNTTRGDVWYYGNDHDGSGQELLAQVLDVLHADPYPLTANGYNESSIPFDMAYLTGLARRYGKPVMPWMQAHAYPACKIVHPDGNQVRKMYGQHARFRSDGIMWLGYKPGKRDFTFPDNSPSAWAEAARVHAEIKARGPAARPRPGLAVVRPYAVRARAAGRGDSADEKLRRYVKDWSVGSKGEYDIFEVPPFQTKAEREQLEATLKEYAYVAAPTDGPGVHVTTNAAGRAEISERKGLKRCAPSTDG